MRAERQPKEITWKGKKWRPATIVETDADIERLNEERPGQKPLQKIAALARIRDNGPLPATEFTDLLKEPKQVEIQIKNAMGNINRTKEAEGRTGEVIGVKMYGYYVEVEKDKTSKRKKDRSDK
jgi:hypothetical protein